MTAAALAAIHRDGRFLMQRRDPLAKRFPGLWEFPGGKVEPGETPREAVVRELEEEIGWRPEAAEALGRIDHDYPWGRAELHLFLCGGAPRPRTELAWGWFTARELLRLAMPEANLRLAGILERRIRA